MWLLFRSSKQAGVGAQVVSEISERAVLSLEAPIGRVSAPDTIFPFGQAENIWLPNAKRYRRQSERNRELLIVEEGKNRKWHFNLNYRISVKGSQKAKS